MWDEPKRQSHLAKHGLDFADPDLDFLLGAVLVRAHSGRSRATGGLNGMLVVSVVFQPLGREAISIVSPRPASKKETVDHEQGI